MSSAKSKTSSALAKVHCKPFGEALNIFYVLFCDLDQCVGSFVDTHALCFLDVYL